MKPEVMEAPGWSPARRWTWIALVFAAQIGLIFALSDRKAVPPRPPVPALVVRLASETDELLALNDPTLFALPQRQGFAGAAWLKTPEVSPPPYRFIEEPRLLKIRSGDLGGAFAEFMRTNRFAGLGFESKTAPELPPPVAAEIGLPAPANSTWRLVGDLATRAWLNPPELQPWPAADLLTNTAVQVLVDAEGNVRSHTLLPSDSSSPNAEQRAADQRALELARAARFQPLLGASSALAFGVLIFEWRTVPLTNPPATSP